MRNCFDPQAMRRNCFAPFAIAIGVTLAACSGNSPEASLAAAKAHLAKNESKAALIEIKNALQVQPDLPEARYLLGAALLDVGDPNGAELELRKALSLKYVPDLTIPKLAAALLAKGEYKKLIDEFSSVRLVLPASTADLQTSIATSHGAQRNAQSSNAALAAALAADPGFSPALIEQARQQAGRREFDAALATVERVLGKAPQNAEAWKLKGDILLASTGQQEEAMANYRRAITAKSGFLPAHLAVVVTLAQQGKTEEAQRQLDQVKTFAGTNLQTKYFESLLAYQRKDYKQARESVQQLLKVAPDSAMFLLLAGSVEFQANSLVQAEVHLSRAVRVAPKAAPARRLLVATYLRLNQPDKALAALRPAQSKEEVAPELYSMAGQAHLQKGDLKAAEEYFSRAAKLDPTDARKRTTVAVMHLRDDESLPAFDELHAIAASDKGVSADLALISAYIARKKFDKALGVIDELERKQPDSPLAATLRGRALVGMNEIASARKSFERARELAPNHFFPATANLAALDVATKRPQDAKARIEAFLVMDPKNAQALLALAEVALLTGAKGDEVIEILNRAIAASPSENAPRLALISLYLRNSDLKQAASIAQSAVATFPDRPELLDVLGRVQQAAGEFNQAVVTYNKVIALQPNSAKPHLRLAEVHMAAKSKAEAEQSLRKALEIKPDLLEAQRGLAMLAISSDRVTDALAIARTVQRQRPKEGVGFELEGDISAARRDWGSALTAYRNGLKQVPLTELAIKLHTSLLASGKDAEAEKFASGWRRGHPEDAVFLFHVGDFALMRNDLPLAEASYVAVTKLQPNNAPAFNNLAWVTNRLNKNGAMAYAQKANQLDPNRPAYMDTLALVLADEKKYPEAIALQKTAIELKPGDLTFKLGLAKLYIKSGDKAGARRELDVLAAAGSNFGGQAEVATLMKAVQ